ncbi:MAG: GTP cyclohydrolase II RibA [Pseudomonadota bacterium]
MNLIDGAIADLRRGAWVHVQASNKRGLRIAAAELVLNPSEFKSTQESQAFLLLTRAHARWLQNGRTEDDLTPVRVLGLPPDRMALWRGWPEIPALKAADAPAQTALALLYIADLLPVAIAQEDAPPVSGRASHDSAGLVTDAMIQAWHDQTADLHIAAEAWLPVRLGKESHRARLMVFRDLRGVTHQALIFGTLDPSVPVPVRLHSQCLTGDTFGSLRCDCGDQLTRAMATLGKRGGILLYLSQEGRGIGLVNKLRCYSLQDQGLDTVQANCALGLPVDGRDYRVAKAILDHLSVDEIILLTNNPSKVSALATMGIKVTIQPHQAPAHDHNRHYLEVKKRVLGHLL